MVTCLEIQPCLIIIIIIIITTQLSTCFISFTSLFSSLVSHYAMCFTEGLFDLTIYEILTKRENYIRFMYSGLLDLECTRQLKRKLINC